jgi:RimJ/RimL family protein N-acetyltransferase
VTPPPLTTARLALHPVTADDLEAILRIWRHPEVRRFLFDDEPVTRERTEGILRPFLSGDDAKVGLWTVRPRPDGNVVGTVGLLRATTAAAHDPSLLGAIEVLGILAPDARGRGYAVEALDAVMAYAFDTLALGRLVAVVDVPNEASHRMVERLGFSVTGECDGPRYRARTYAVDAAAFSRRRRAALTARGRSGRGAARGARRPRAG